jgi:hypothetical protein
MPARHGSRFALEAGFLILLAVLAGLADLRWQAIVLVMAIAWLLIALLEWAFWREGPRVPPVPRGYAEWAPPPAPPPPVIAPPAAPPLLPPREDATRIIEPGELEPAHLPMPVETEPAPEAEAPEPDPEPEAEPEAEPEPEREPEPEPEPHEPEAEPDAESSGEEAPPRRPWWWRRREPEAGAEAEPVRPRHVRVLPPGPEREEE